MDEYAVKFLPIKLPVQYIKLMIMHLPSALRLTIIKLLKYDRKRIIETHTYLRIVDK